MRHCTPPRIRNAKNKPVGVPGGFLHSGHLENIFHFADACGKLTEVKKAAFIGVLMFGLSILSIAQTDPAPSCPTISISGPTGIVQPNVAARYTASVDTKGQQFDLKYFWNVTAGKITGGQGTASIEVVQTERESQTVVVEINGLPRRCPDTESLSFSIAPQPEPVNEAVCPVISVLASGGIIPPGEPVRFTADVSRGGDLSGLKYDWSVKSAKIVKGQGTAAIDAVYSDYPRLEATVKISGVPAGCPNTASEIYEFAVDPGPIKLGDVSGPAYEIDKTLLAKIEKEAREQPNAQLYVVLQFEVGTKEDSMQRIRARIVKQLKKTKIDESRITFAMADNGNKEATFWIISPGADNPSIDR